MYYSSQTLSRIIMSTVGDCGIIIPVSAGNGKQPTKVGRLSSSIPYVEPCIVKARFRFEEEGKNEFVRDGIKKRISKVEVYKFLTSLGFIGSSDAKYYEQGIIEDSKIRLDVFQPYMCRLGLNMTLSSSSEIPTSELRDFFDDFHKFVVSGDETSNKYFKQSREN
jgi:hypothetical protein